MVRADVITLIGDNPCAHGVFDKVVPVEREVYCTVRSVGMKESYAARSQGLAPTLVFQLAQSFEYQGERVALYRGERYEIIRTYVTDTDGIELTVERTNQEARP